MARTKTPAATTPPNAIARDASNGGDDAGDGCEDDTWDRDDEEDANDEDGEVAEKAAGPIRRHRTSRASLGNAARIASFQAGQAAHAQGVPDDAPPALHAELLGHWQRGWRVAAAEAARGRGVMIATIYNPAERDIHALRRTCHSWQPGWHGPDRRPEFPTAPWTMAALIGTTWRNLHTGSVVTVDQVHADGFGHPHLCAGLSAYGNDALYPHPRDHIGIWIDDRYVVEHWVRVDHWSPAAQLPWYALRIARFRDAIAQSQASAAEIQANWARTSCASTNYHLALRAATSAQAELPGALDDLHAFAARHGLAVTPDLINATAYRRPALAGGAHAQSEQLSLF